MKKYLVLFLFLSIFCTNLNIIHAEDLSFAKKYSNRVVYSSSNSKSYYVNSKDNKKYPLASKEDIKAYIKQITVNLSSADFKKLTTLKKKSYSNKVLLVDGKYYYVNPINLSLILIDPNSLDTIKKIGIKLSTTDINKIGAPKNLGQVVGSASQGKINYDPLISKNGITFNSSMSPNTITIIFSQLINESDLQNRSNYVFKDTNGNILTSKDSKGLNDNGNPITNPIIYTGDALWLKNKAVNIDLGLSNDNYLLKNGRYIIEISNLKLISGGIMDSVQKIGLDYYSTKTDNVPMYDLYSSDSSICSISKGNPSGIKKEYAKDLINGSLNFFKSNSDKDYIDGKNYFFKDVNGNKPVEYIKTFTNVNFNEYEPARKAYCKNKSISTCPLRGSCDVKIDDNICCDNGSCSIKAGGVLYSDGSVRILKKCSWDEKDCLGDSKISDLSIKIDSQNYYKTYNSLVVPLSTKITEDYGKNGAPNDEDINFVVRDFIITKNNEFYRWSKQQNVWIKADCGKDLPKGDIILVGLAPERMILYLNAINN